ncbi:MAG: DUF2232 domain-containing protein [Acidobacteria bacterium]|nr:DUF2232 domain-containing protein [Acidobacteriota bacterium]MBV9071532.1 DUF2232 domain-containing protein [Acidobacteriota bacterium]MBV9187021.1 DUF2232 domain-containing protein [Acidobacteriota bacterium]
MTETLQQDEPVAMPVRTFGKQARSMAGYALATALMFVSPLFVFIPASLLHCGIRMGRRAALLLLVLSTAAAALLIYPAAAAASAAEASASYGFLLGLFLAIAVPALAVLPRVERGEKFGRVLLSALVLSVVGLAVTELTMRTFAHVSLYAAQVADVHAQTAVMVGQFVKAGYPADRFQFLQKWTDLCVPASLLTAAATAFVFSLVMLGRLRAWRDFLVRRTPDAVIANPYRFRYLSLPEWLLFAFVIGGLSPLASGMLQQVGANILVITLFLYLLQGLAMFRMFVAATGAGPMGSLFAWMLLGILTLTGIAPLLLCIAGLFDSFFDFRHFNRKDHSDESHSH